MAASSRACDAEDVGGDAKVGRMPHDLEQQRTFRGLEKECAS